MRRSSCRLKPRTGRVPLPPPPSGKEKARWSVHQKVSQTHLVSYSNRHARREAPMAYKSLLVTLLCLHLRDAAAFGSFPAQHPAPPPAPPSAPPVGCMEASTAANAACDFSTANINLTSFCSGDCHDALMSASISCDANDRSEAQNKTKADQYLSSCSGSCGRLASEYFAACDLGGVSPSRPTNRATAAATATPRSRLRRPAATPTTRPRPKSRPELMGI